MEKDILLELITASRAGDRGAQERLIAQIQNRVYYQCKKMLKNEEDALDATQDVLISVLTGIDKLREPEAFYGWVNGITANRCKHLLTQGMKEWQIPEDEEGNSLLDQYEDLDDQVLPDKALDNDETRRMIVQLVDDLPEAQRMTVLLYYYDEMSVRDIAAAMETSEGTVKSRLNYARKSIKEGVEEYERKGVKLYGMSPLPLLLYFLCKDAAVHVLSKEAALQLTASAVEASAAAVATASVAGTAAGTASATASTTSATAAGTAAAATAKAGTALGVKIAAAATAVAVLGGGAAVVAHRSPSPSPTASPVTEATVLPETVAPEPTMTPQMRYRAYDQILRHYMSEDYSFMELPQGTAYLLDCNGDGEEELLLQLYNYSTGCPEAYIYSADQDGAKPVLQAAQLNVTQALDYTLDFGSMNYEGTEYLTLRYFSWSNIEEFTCYWIYTEEDGVYGISHELQKDITIDWDTVSGTPNLSVNACLLDGDTLPVESLDTISATFQPFIDPYTDESAIQNCHIQCLLKAQRAAWDEIPTPVSDALGFESRPSEKHLNRYAVFAYALEHMHTVSCGFGCYAVFADYDGDGEDELLVLNKDQWYIGATTWDYDFESGEVDTISYDYPCIPDEISDTGVLDLGYVVYGGRQYLAARYTDSSEDTQTVEYSLWCREDRHWLEMGEFKGSQAEGEEMQWTEYNFWEDVGEGQVTEDPAVFTQMHNSFTSYFADLYEAEARQPASDDGVSVSEKSFQQCLTRCILELGLTELY